MSEQAPGPRVPPRSRPSRMAVVRGSLRALISVIVLVALYYELPLQGPKKVSDGVAIAIGLAVFIGVAVIQVRSIIRASYPVLRAVQVLAIILPLFVLLFASSYYVMESSNAASFSSGLSRTDALYFTVTVFSTVGFGDIVARSEAARVVVTFQMLGDLIVVGVLIRLIASAARIRRDEVRQSAAADTRQPVDR